jgi:hypothetical protein
VGRVKPHEMYYLIQNYVLIGMLILLAIGIAMMFIGIVIDKIKTKNAKHKQKRNDKNDL